MIYIILNMSNFLMILFRQRDNKIHILSHSLNRCEFLIIFHLNFFTYDKLFMG